MLDELDLLAIDVSEKTHLMLVEELWARCERAKKQMDDAYVEVCQIWEERLIVVESISQGDESMRQAFDFYKSVCDELLMLRVETGKKVQELREQAKANYRQMNEYFTDAITARNNGHYKKSQLLSEKGYAKKEYAINLEREINQLFHDAKEKRREAEARVSKVGCASFLSALNSLEKISKRLVIAKATFKQAMARYKQTQAEFESICAKYLR